MPVANTGVAGHPGSGTRGAALARYGAGQLQASFPAQGAECRDR